MANRFIRRAELSRALGVHPATTHKWEQKGKLPPHTSLSFHVAGWYLFDLPPEFQKLFEESPAPKFGPPEVREGV